MINKPIKDRSIGKNFGLKPPYYVQFDMRIVSKVSSWGNILHVGNENFHRSPAIFLYPNSSRLHVRVSRTHGRYVEPKIQIKDIANFSFKQIVMFFVQFSQQIQKIHALSLQKVVKDTRKCFASKRQSITFLACFTIYRA